MAHTILLIQPGYSIKTRTYTDFESVNECMQGLMNIYEAHLKERNENAPVITYNVEELFDFIDQILDISCFVFHKEMNTYCPYDRDWIKEKCYNVLRQQAKPTTPDQASKQSA